MAQSLASSREALTGARGALLDSVQGPAQLFETRKAELAALVKALPGATLEEQVTMLPEIASLTQEVIQLAKQSDVYGDDVAAFRQLQQLLLRQLDEAEAFAAAAQAAVQAQQEEVLRQEKAAQDAFLAQQALFLTHQEEAQEWLEGIHTALVQAQKEAQTWLENEAAALQQAQRAAQDWLTAQQKALLAHEEAANAVIAAQQADLLAHQKAAQAWLAEQHAALVAAEKSAAAALAAQSAALEQSRAQQQAYLAVLTAQLTAAQEFAQAHFAAQEAQLLKAQQDAQAVLAAQEAALVQAQVAHADALKAHDNLLAQEAARTQEAQTAIQQQLVAILDNQRASTQSNFSQAISEAQAQRATLLATLEVSRTQENYLANAVLYLTSINSLLDLNFRQTRVVGSFQTEPGEVRQIPRTGLALVHRGELIGRPAQGDTFAPVINLTIHAQGSAPQAVAEATTQAIDQTIRELERRRRYRQTRAA